jgi:choline dehydrogenase-like flavoprotein
MDDDRRVIVIGSGPSGATAAMTLVKQGIPVTMLESGDRLPDGLLIRVAGRNLIRKRPRIEDPKHHIASDDPEASWYHALMPGGMSSHWAGAVPRFAPEDFYEGERLHERYRWPIGYDDLRPYYDRIERLLSVAAARCDVASQPACTVAYERHLPKDWQHVARGAEAYGHGLTPLPLAAGPQWTFRRTGVGFNSFTSIVRPLQRSPHFRLCLGAHVVGLDWNGAERRVTAVRYVDRATGAEHRLAAAAVVLAAGPLASTKLLLESACPDFPDGLGNTDGILGRYLHDHPHDIGTLQLDRSISCFSQAAVLTRAPYQDSAPLLGASCVIGSNSAWDKARTVTPLGTRRFGLWIFGTMVPSDRNQVRLHPEAKDELGRPALDVHIRYDDDVRKNIVAARQRLADVLNAAGYAATIESSTPTLVPGESIHYGGTVRMHSSKRYGMLDGRNRLHAVNNVAVTDASCFTTGPEKNPTLTVMAIAARASEHLAADLKSA